MNCRMICVSFIASLLVPRVLGPRRLRDPGVQLVDHGHDRGVPLGGVVGGAESLLLPLDLGEDAERELLAVLVDDAVGERLLLPDVDADHGLEVADVHELGDELRRDAAGGDGRHVETDLSVLEVDVQVGHLSGGHLVLAEGDAGEETLDIVVLTGLLALAHPLGELAHADVETDGTVGGIASAGERSVVTHGLKGLNV